MKAKKDCKKVSNYKEHFQENIRTGEWNNYLPVIKAQIL